MHRIASASKLFIWLPVLLIVSSLCGLDPLASQNKKAEDFVVYSINGTRTVFYDHLGSLPDNGVLLVNFTSIYCRPCRKEIPELVKITANSGGRAKLICIYSENGNPVKELASELNILDNTYVDPFGNIQKQYDVKKIPVTFVVARDFTILGRYDGYTEDNIGQIEKLVMDK